MQRSTAQVLEDHLRLRQAAQLDMDLEQNYASDVILLCDHGAFKGRDAVRKSGDDLTAQLPDGRFEYGVKYVTGDYAYIQWTADSATNRIEDGADTFVIRNGHIIMQSIFIASSHGAECFVHSIRIPTSIDIAAFSGTATLRQAWKGSKRTPGDKAGLGPSSRAIRRFARKSSFLRLVRTREQDFCKSVGCACAK